jgi:hypothetical protein
VTKKELRQFLEGHSREQLSEWLLGVAKDSPDFRQRLDFYAGTHHSFAEASKAVLQAIEQFERLRSERRSLRQAEIVRPCQFLLEGLRACHDISPSEELLPIVERTMVALDHLIGTQIQPTPRLFELQSEFATLHLKLAGLQSNNGADLAERLFHMKAQSRARILPDCPQGYLECLGEEGLRRYRELLEPTYREVVHGEVISRARSRSLLLRREMLFDWTLVSENLEEQVAILSAMASKAEDVLSLAGYLDERQRPMDALQCVQKAFAKAPNVKLAEFLADRLEKQNQAFEAMEYRWYLFEQLPTLTSFGALMQAAGQVRAGSEWREKAMKHAAEKAKGLHVELLLQDDLLDEALGQARVHGAPISAWLKLADAFARKDSKTAIDLYFDCAEFALKERRSDQYIPKAWQLAVDGGTFQIFSARLRLLFGKQKIPDWYVEKLVEQGVPVAKLLAF